MSELDDDRPEASAQADVTLVARGITVTAAVHESSTKLLVLKPMLGSLPRDTAVSEVETDRGARWYLSVDGPSERSKRRRTVRARVELPVQIPWAGGEMVGRTHDLSESGTLALVDGWGLPPEPGAQIMVSLNLGQSYLDVRGEVLRQQFRAVQWLLAIRFTNTTESVQDRLRRRVFQALREERARLNS
jgi:hypothetical protein